MTIEPVRQVQGFQPAKPQTLMGAADQLATSPASSTTDQSFAATLAEIASEQMALNTLTGTPFSGSGGGSSGMGNVGSLGAGGQQGGVNLLTAILSTAQGFGVPSGSAANATSGTEPTGADVVAKAAQLSGTPYVWGGTTARGFDCSGFTKYVYGELGVSLPRTSQQQATSGASIQGIAQAKPGDLLFFAGSDGTPSSPGHVGIYVGNGEMIDAPYTGATVQIQPVSSAGPVVAIRRILSDANNSGDKMIGSVKVPAQYVAVVEQAAAANGIPPSLLAALISEESGFNPSALSPAGAQGIAQFMPSTAAGLGIDPADPVSSINGAAKLIAAYAANFGSYAKALAAYNSGPAAVARYSGVPPYPETQAYVLNILSMSGVSGLKGIAS